MRWLSARDLGAEGVRLFCLPHAGSGAAGFYRWKRLLPASVAVCPVLLPGREARLGESPLTDVAAIVEELLRHASDHLHRPYAIFGHSMSALLAYEWTRRIQESGLPIPLRLFVSGRKAPQTEASHTQLHQMPPDIFVRELKDRYGGDPGAILADPELRDLFLPIMRSDLQVVETYEWKPGEPLRCDFFACAGEHDHSVSTEGLAKWGAVTAGAFESRRFAGDHFYHFGSGQTELLRTIGLTLETHSSAARSASRAEG